MGEPTFDQIADLILLGQEITALLTQVNVHLIYLSKISLAGFGLMIGSQIWRNFILAKNQRNFW